MPLARCVFCFLTHGTGVITTTAGAVGAEQDDVREARAVSGLKPVQTRVTRAGAPHKCRLRLLLSEGS